MVRFFSENLTEMFFVNYFARREIVKKVLTDAEIDVKKVCWYCKDCNKCERFYSITSEVNKRVFQHLTRVINIGMLEITNNLKLDLLEITYFECNFYM